MKLSRRLSALLLAIALACLPARLARAGEFDPAEPSALPEGAGEDEANDPDESDESSDPIEPDDLRGAAALLMDAETGQVLYEKNGYVQMSPASLTKILTGMLALELLDPDELITASSAAVRQPGSGTTAGIEAGEELTVEQAMYAMMLRSANEAANILAEAAAGSADAFVERMNERAAELGARDSRFANPSGLPSRGQQHYTTAYDLALITRAAIETPGFLNYFGADSYTMASTNLSDPRTFTHTHLMLPADSWRYNPEVIGGKTGYTAQAGYTLATVAERGGRVLICIVLNSDSYYDDTLELLEFGFEEFHSHPFVIGPVETVEVPVMEEDWLAGRLFLSLGETEIDLLLHESVDPEDLLVVPVYPEQMEGEEALVAGVALRLPEDRADGLPETTLTLAFDVVRESYERPAVEAMAEPAAVALSPPEPDQELFVLAVAFGVAGAAVLLPLMVRRVLRGRRPR